MCEMPKNYFTKVSLCNAVRYSRIHPSHGVLVIECYSVSVLYYEHT